jgi:RNA polymerase sigma-B factor
MERSMTTVLESDSGYENLLPLLAELSSYEAADPQREELRQYIIERSLPLADHIARRFSRRGEPNDDLVQVARVGLIRAVDRFDVSVGAEFLSFAVPTIMGEVRRHFRDHTWAMRVPRTMQETFLRVRTAVENLSQELGHAPTPKEIATELGEDVDNVVEALMAGNAYQLSSLDGAGSDLETTSDPTETFGEVDPGYEYVEQYLTVKPLLAALPDREREVLVMRFFDAMTQTQIAHRIGVSQMQVSRILSRTLGLLREQSGVL